MEGEESKKEVAVSPPRNIPGDTSDDQDSDSDSAGFETPPETISPEEKEENKETNNGGSGGHSGGGGGYVVSDVSSLLRTLDTEGVLERKIGILIKDGEEEGEEEIEEEEASFEDVDFDDLPGGETKPSTEKSPPPLSLMDPASLSKDLFLMDKIEDFLDNKVEEPCPQDTRTDMQGEEPHPLLDMVHLQENEPENDPQSLEQQEPEEQDPIIDTCSSEESLVDKPDPQDDQLDEPQENEVPLRKDEPHPQNEENEIESTTEYNETNEPLPQEENEPLPLEENEPLPQEDNEPLSREDSKPQEEGNELQQEDITKPYPSPQEEGNRTQEDVTEPQEDKEPLPQEVEGVPQPQEDNEPLSQDETNKPIPQEANEPLVQEEENEPLPQEEDDEPLPQNDSEPPPQDETNKPVPQEANEPLIQEEENEPLPQEEDNEPLPQEEDNEPLVQEEDNEPLPQEEDNEPLPQEEDNEPLLQEEDNEPLPQEEDNEPLPQEEDNEPLLQEEDNEPLPQEEENESLPEEEDDEPLPQEEENESLPEEDDEPLPQEKENEPLMQEEVNEPLPQEEESVSQPQHLQEDYVIIKDDKCVNTDLILNTDIESQTDILTTSESSNQTINPILVDSSTNTTIDINELMQLANIGRERREREESIQSVMAELNQERSQRLVNDQLVKILETDVTALQQRNVTELSERLKLENEISDLKAEYAHSQNELKESNNRVNELEESLSGTLLLVRKLEEQSATITNKGGVDYLLQAKIADGRAQEAEQQLQVLQAELLQSQAEVKRLLDRLGELSRGRQEMVSGAVHSQLLELSDRRAEEAERRVRELEQQVVLLKSSREGGSSSNRYMDTTSFPSLTSAYKYPLAGMGGSLMTGTYSSNPSPYSSNLSPYSSNPYISGSATTTSYFDQGPLDYTRQLGGGFPFNPKQEEGISPHHGRSEGLSFNKGDGSYARLDNKTNDDSLTFSSFLKNQNSSSQWLQETTRTTLSPPKEATPTTLLPPVSYNEASQSLLLPPINNDGPSHELLMSKPPLMTSSKDGESDDDDDDDWSTSDEEGEDREESVDGDSLRPTAHMNLRSKFEWLSAQNVAPSTQQSLPTLHPELPQAPPPAISDTGRRVPPPIAPKPKLFRTISSDIKGEGPISFDEVMKPPSLKTYIRPRGPRGRRPPSGY
ncbi:PREDICTED: titin-like [Amphimedon queenslandica]|uniref:Uncharacterized protein n=1 Tax=Amphimedon queenslandica TaxID=400682 RepID=A0A1X7VNW8_AMPQE|nr:PREDICTED: titin-like [Amphimedon queenslandica]|eukprot:XP_003383424.1 PREDICTED: titin-like [Amphimedon queenslandica]